MTAPRAVFRADASREIGGGHVYRCLSLATGLKDLGWDVSFCVRPGSEVIVPSLADPGFAMIEASDDPEEVVRELRSRLPNGVDLLVVDHYRLDARWEQQLRGWVGRIAVIDDLSDRPHDCDLLLDQTSDPERVSYDGLVPEGCVRLIGQDYALLRPSFAAARPEALRRRMAGGAVETVLVQGGAADSGRIVAPLLEGLDLSGLPVEARVTIGAGAPHLADLRRFASRLVMPVAFHADVGPEMANLMAGADLMVGAAGSSLWEGCCVGLPAIMVRTADNQRGVIERLVGMGAAIDLGGRERLSPARLAAAFQAICADHERRARMSHSAAMIADGLGTARALLALVAEQASKGGKVRLRPVTLADSARILDWQRAPGVRRHFRNPEPPTEAKHQAWFADRLSRVDRGLFAIVLEDETPVGFVRMDPRPLGADPGLEVSILIAPRCQGRGVGRAALRAARRLQPVGAFFAHVNPDNERSRDAFTGCGYQPIGGDWLVHPGKVP